MEKVATRHAPRSRAEGKGERQDPPGEVVETERGPVLVRTLVFERGFDHGREPIGAFLEGCDGLAVLAREGAIAKIDPAGALFLDTETTGLAGGTGTLPFLVGLAWFEAAGAMTVEQIFCREPAEEPAQLELLSARLAGAGYLVTFNGRAYDIPLVNTRFVMNRMRNPGAALPHLDLLHVARRIFGRRLDDRSLVSIERTVLGFRREGDIPGAEIPAAYSAFLRGGPPDDMARVMEHNAFDLTALAALGGVLERMYGNPEEVEHAADSLGLARAAFEAGQVEAADRHLFAAAGSDSPDDRRVGLYMAARHAARQKDFDRARDLWLRAVELDAADAWAHLALAKHFEHREKDYPRALEHAGRCAEAEGEEGCAYRVARIERKLARSREEEER